MDHHCHLARAHARTGAGHVWLPIGILVGRRLAGRASDLSAHPDRNSAMNARTRHDFLIMAIATAITLGVAVGATIAYAAVEIWVR
jgi:hypothetical protein